jgi:glutaredoxin 3
MKKTMPHIEIYSTAMCPYCVRAKMLLQSKGMKWKEIRIDKDRNHMMEMMQRSQRRTVPQIFIDGTHIGGFDDLAALEGRGKLDPLLQSEDGPT